MHVQPKTLQLNGGAGCPPEIPVRTKPVASVKVWVMVAELPSNVTFVGGLTNSDGLFNGARRRQHSKLACQRNVESTRHTIGAITREERCGRQAGKQAGRQEAGTGTDTHAGL